MREITLMRMNDVVAILEYSPRKGMTRVSVTVRTGDLHKSNTYDYTPCDELVKDYQAQGFNLYSDRTF